MVKDTGREGSEESERSGELRESFGDRLKQARREFAVAKRRDVTQQEVADALGVSAVTVGRWEDGTREPDFATVAWLAAFLRVRAGYLAFGELPVRDAVRASGAATLPALTGGGTAVVASGASAGPEADDDEARERRKDREALAAAKAAKAAAEAEVAGGQGSDAGRAPPLRGKRRRSG